MPVESITHIGLNLGPNMGANDTIIEVRVVPSGKEGNAIYGRTLNAGEFDRGEHITLEVGEKLVFPPGSVSVNMADVDRYAEPQADGYASVTNMVWIWLQIPPHSGDEFFHYMLAASRRLDQAHALWASALRDLDNRPDAPFIQTLARLFDALGNAESMCNALHRAVNMLGNSPSMLGAKTPVPAELLGIQTQLAAIRDAFEHIDERAIGRARREGLVDALSIFQQGDFIRKGVLRYAGYSLNLQTEILPVLLAARKFVYDVIAEPGNTKAISTEITMGPVTEDSGGAGPAAGG